MPNEMTPDQLRALHAKATPGRVLRIRKWARSNEQMSAEIVTGEDDKKLLSEMVADLRFCADAIEELPAILDRLERAERERDELAFELGKVNRAVTSPELYTAIHESLKPSRDKRDARMKTLGAAET